MNNSLKKMINEEFNRSMKKKTKYEKTRALVESYVREALTDKIMNESKKNTRVTKRDRETRKLSQVQQALSDPAINKAGLARKIAGLSHDDDARRSEISKIARGKWKPSVKVINNILHAIASDTE